MSTQPPRVGHVFLKFVGKACLLCLAVAFAALPLVKRFGGPGGEAAVPWASGAALLGCLLGRLAGLLVPRGAPEAPAQAALVGLTARLLSTAALCFVLLQARVAPSTPFVAVVVTQYLALLVLEVSQAVAEVRAASSAPRVLPPDESKSAS